MVKKSTLILLCGVSVVIGFHAGLFFGTTANKPNNSYVYSESDKAYYRKCIEAGMVAISPVTNKMKEEDHKKFAEIQKKTCKELVEKTTLK